ncbi:MAG: tRNA (adenosine(37)-N6)-dimethylallyltransferase MiaA [Arcanobacterium sp.]|nr:tRNA (adenosine(37)-N6)-dimethylallyltransferase MiaA [Arcanobacterium sp.]
MTSPLCGCECASQDGGLADAQVGRWATEQVAGQNTEQTAGQVDGAVARSAVQNAPQGAARAPDSAAQVQHPTGAWSPLTTAMPVVAIVGPTASGKTALSLDLADELGGPERVEIISADAMQLYRGMDIGTAKATLAERRGIVHHQIDVLDVTQEASVAIYQRKARADIERISASGKIPLLVGGSGLYVSAVLDELNFPGTDAAVRAELEDIAARFGFAPLIAELREKDPVTAATIDLANPRRVIRALEVVRITGGSYTPVFPRHTSHYRNVVELGVRSSREFLNPRIEARARAMFEGGLIEETQALLDQGLRTGVTARKATGYTQAIQLIDGEISLEEAISSTVYATKRLAKKQRTWFRADQRIVWLKPHERSAHVAAQMVRAAQNEAAWPVAHQLSVAYKEAQENDAQKHGAQENFHEEEK